MSAGAGASSREPVGSVAEEAARLLGALQDAAGTWAGAGHTTAGRPTADHGPADHGPADHGPGDHGPADHETPAACRVCPLCQVIAAVQQVKPETVQHLADAAASLAAALSDVLAGARQSPPDPGTARPERERRDDVQRIDITD